jgi:hypothetical protein
MTRTTIEKAHGVIEKTIDDLDSISTVLSLVAFEKLEPEEMRAVARGGFEMVGRLDRDLRGVLPTFAPADAAPAVPD